MVTALRAQGLRVVIFTNDQRLPHGLPKLVWADGMSRNEVRRAMAKGREAAPSEPRAASARYDAAGGRVIVELTNGCTFAFPADLADIETLCNGFGLHWPTLDLPLAIPDPMADLLDA